MSRIELIIANRLEKWKIEEALTVQKPPCDRPVFKVRKVQKRDFGLCRLDGGLCLWDDCYCRRTEVCTLEINFACEWYTENNWLNRYRLRKKRGVANERT